MNSCIETYKKRWIVGLLILVVLIISSQLVFGWKEAVSIFFKKNSLAEEDLRFSEKEKNNFDGEILTVKFFDEKNFYDSLLWLKNNPKNFPNCQIAGAVIPHHLLAGFMPARLFSKLADNQIKTIIMVGPNHWEKGGNVLSSDVNWKTEFGIVHANKEIISDFEKKGLLQIENGVMQEEHSTTGLFPLLKYYLPETEIVPIILSAKNTQAEIEKLSVEINEHLKDEKTVLISSIDFSHYLNQADAEKNDAETIRLVKSFDYQNIFGLSNDYLDSPSSMAMFILAAEKNGDKNIEVIEHANSADILGGNVASTTSYYSLAYCRKNN